MKIAMFGGSFNPVHNGHLELAKAVHEQAGYDKVLFVPAYHSPFKSMPSGASDDDRLRMLHLALDSLDWAFIEDCELRRGGMSYTYETVEFLEQKYAASGELTGKLGLVIGADLLAGFMHWHRAEDLVVKVDVILARRKLENGATVPESGTVAPHAEFEASCICMPETGAIAGMSAQKTLQSVESVETAETVQSGTILPFVQYKLQNPYVDVSSSEIRSAVHEASGSAVSKKKLLALVPEGVCDYILERGLYD